MYADDTTISVSATNAYDLQNQINSELLKLHRWLIANKLSLNITKPEFMIIGSRQRLKARTDGLKMQLNIEENEISKVDFTKSVGVFIDKNYN